ncbi:MAG: nicotinate-nucleotide adenylyltransferase [Erysipelotrichaceae bacterium]|nr:MAG: nicotinate-nucleotide [Erysipelotrichaceae bacterium]TXT17499.1 MAG: nicotinate-nucleotide adenylyltransferase [Erysipelotrichaceae bacterium]
MTKIACFGGSFNPPHLGHLKIALTVLRQEHFDEVWFLPTLSTPLKKNPMASFEDRLQMLELLIKPYRKLKVCTIEESLPLPNYTINTVRALHSIYPNHHFTWIIGSDQSVQFSQWKDHETLLTLVDFMVVVREIDETLHPAMKVIRIPGIEQFSSTNIRSGKLKDTTPEIIRYIFDHELYMESIARSMVSERRWQHTKQVEKLALELAAIHHLDPHHVRVSALFHDCTKNWIRDISTQWLMRIDPTYLTMPSAIWHQKTAEAYLKSLGIKDKVILDAIGHHVVGQKGHPVSQVIFIADKCEPTRDYDPSQELALARIDLDAAAELVRQKQQEYIQKEINAKSTTSD